MSGAKNNDIVARFHSMIMIRFGRRTVTRNAVAKGGARAEDVHVMFGLSCHFRRKIATLPRIYQRKPFTPCVFGRNPAYSFRLVAAKIGGKSLVGQNLSLTFRA